MRWWLIVCLAACGKVNPGGGVDAATQRDAPAIPTDACPDADSDGVCDSVDKCPGFDDHADADHDTVADGCDVCPGVDDTVDANHDGIPDGCPTSMLAIAVKNVGGNYWRGWHVTDGTPHSSANDNTITGNYRGGSNSYFVFPLTGITVHAVVAAHLELSLENYTSTDASETYQVWDVSTPSATLEADGTTMTEHDDLQTGHMYGMTAVTSASVGTVTMVTLDSQAFADIKAAAGNDFAVGIHLADATVGYIRFSSASEALTHNLVITYVP